MKLAMRMAATEGFLDDDIWRELPREYVVDKEEEKIRQLKRAERKGQQPLLPPSGLDEGLCLHSAIYKVGRVLFSDKNWRYADGPRRSSISEFPVDPQCASPELHERAEMLLRRYAAHVAQEKASRAIFDEPFCASSREVPSNQKHIQCAWTPGDWQLVIKLDKTGREEERKLWYQGQYTRQVLAKLFLTGEIQTLACALDGGELIAIPKDFWNTQFWWRRFWFGRFDYNDPYNGNAIGSHWILVDQQGLHKFMEIITRKPSTPAPASAPPAYRSLFMQFM
ncbi:MAG: hypothetical protein WBX25_28900, partial [Rhodomicrobium sp.]